MVTSTRRRGAGGLIVRANSLARCAFDDAGVLAAPLSALRAVDLPVRNAVPVAMPLGRALAKWPARSPYCLARCTARRFASVSGVSTGPREPSCQYLHALLVVTVLSICCFCTER